MFNLAYLLASILATYGLATILSQYDGPFQAFTLLRNKAPGNLFDCNVCLLPYFALLPTFLLGIGLVGYLATIGGGLVLARLT